MNNNYMKKINVLFISIIAVMLYSTSCIDRDTIAGTGKEEPERIISSGGGFQTGIVNTKLPIPIKIRILAANGRPVRGILVEFTVEKSNATFSDTTAVTDGNGYAQTTVTLGSKADSIFVFATVLGLKGSPVKFSLFSVTSGAANVELLSGNNQTGYVGKALGSPLKVIVTDSYGNLVPNVPIYFSTTNGKCDPSVAFTDSSGIASSKWTLDTLVGNKTAQALVPSIQKGTVDFSAKAISLTTPAVFEYASNSEYYIMQGANFGNILKVRVLDKYKNPLYVAPPNNFGVEFKVTRGDGQVFPSFSPTNISGIATAGVSIAETDTSFQVVAEVGFSFPPLPFTFTVYKYLQIDSLNSSGGVVTVYWQKNLNAGFANYTLQRCNSFNFDSSTVAVKVITDENITSGTDTTPVVGTSPFYRLKINYTSGFYFYSNLRDVLVKP